MIEITDATLIAGVSGLASGLIAWGGVRNELRALRRDVEKVQADASRAHDRIDSIFAPHNRRADDT